MENTSSVTDFTHVHMKGAVWGPLLEFPCKGINKKKKPEIQTVIALKENV